MLAGWASAGRETRPSVPHERIPLNYFLSVTSDLQLLRPHYHCAKATMTFDLLCWLGLLPTSCSKCLITQTLLFNTA